MKNDVKLYKEKITSSYIYADDKYQYRHITLPKEIADYLPDSMCLLKESEYRQLGVEISAGWEHYMIHAPEPNILLLRRSHELSKKIEEERKAKKLKEKAAKEKEPSSTSSTAIKKSSVASK
ncbi:regulatory subunit of cyclin-dependent kinase [Cunninghamella echinulata]|nr:regulatory subunit of cyclin-dependent kinase [Cunninghamella echinulata]